MTRGIVDALPLPLLLRADRTVDPPLTEADVIRLTRPETWRHTDDEVAARCAAFVALAACARVGFSAAARMELKVHWRPGGSDVVVVPDGSGDRVVPLLPFARRVVSFYIDRFRPKTRDPHLFVSSTGRKLGLFLLRSSFYRIGRHLGIRGTELHGRLFDFFDRGFDDVSDKQAVYALIGAKCRVPGYDPDEKAATAGKICRVMLGNHLLRGPAGRYEGGRGDAFLSTAKQNLLPPPSARRLAPSAAMSEDPVVLGLTAVVWPADRTKWRRFRAGLKKLYFPYLDELRKAGRLRRREIAFLLRATLSAVDYYKAERRAQSVPKRVVVRSVAAWRRIVVARYQERPDGETVHRFFLRLERDEFFGLSKAWVYQTLYVSGDLKRRRGRPRKRHKD